MSYITGETIDDIFVSVDINNNPIVPANFQSLLIKNGIVYTAITISPQISYSAQGIYSYSFSADTVGNYQVFIKNITTNVIYTSDVFKITDGGENITYIGL
jgi:hypothetical protein